MEFNSINPYSGEVVATYPAQSTEGVQAILQRSREAFEVWRLVPLEERCALMREVANILRGGVEEYGRVITLEMGKPIAESRC